MIPDVFNKVLRFVLECFESLRRGRFDEDLSSYISSVSENVHGALASYLSRLELFHSMSIATIFSRISTNAEDSHNFFIVLLVFSFSLLMTFAGVKARKMLVIYPFTAGCIYFLLVSPIRNIAFIRRVKDLYNIEASGVGNLMQLARQINLHLIIISLVLTPLVLYFYSTIKYTPAFVLIFHSWNAFAPADPPTSYVSFAVFAILMLYVYSKIFVAIERIMLAAVFSFFGSFMLVTHVNVASPQGSISIPSYEEFLKSFSAESMSIRINICTILFVFTFILGICKQLETKKK